MKKKTIGDHLYVAALLPYNRDMKVDEQAYRRFLRHFLDNDKFVRMGGGICVNPEAGEIFYLTREEKRRVLEIAMEEINGKVPVIAGTWAITTEETVETAKDCKALGVDGIFVTPPVEPRTSPRAGMPTAIRRSGWIRSSRRTAPSICRSLRTRSAAPSRHSIPVCRPRRPCASAARSRTSSAGR